MTNIISKLANQIAGQRAKIIDDFCKAYLASKSYGMTTKQIIDLIRRLEIIEQRTSDGLGYIYSFRVKRSRSNATVPRFSISVSKELKSEREPSADPPFVNSHTSP